MSLAINTTTPEGIVLAADSRQSYRNRKRMTRVGSDNAVKIFELNRRIGVAVTGLAFLPEDGVLKNISKFIEQFKKESEISNFDVKRVTRELHSFFNKKYSWPEQLAKLQEKIRQDLTKQGCELLEMKQERYLIKFKFRDPKGREETRSVGLDGKINLLIAGYNKDGSHEVYTVCIPGKIERKRNSREKGGEYGASWIGQGDVVSRIIIGRDKRIGNIKFVYEAQQKYGAEDINKQLRNLEYVIQWGTMTLQDAIDFCTLMIQTTSAIQRFSDGIRADPGDMPGVGGPGDIAVITPDKGFVWVSKKKLTAGELELDLDKVPNLPLSTPKPTKPSKRSKTK